MYQDHYLRFPDEQTMLMAFQAEPVSGPDGDYIVYKAVQDLAVDIIGTIYRPTGNMLTVVVGPGGDVVEIPETEPIDGWHVNIRSTTGLPAGVAEYEIDKPNNPARVWA